MTTRRPEHVLSPATEEAVAQVGQADVLVGLHSFNNAATIEHVVRAVTAGLAKYCPGKRAVLVNADGGSTDGTPDLVAQAAVDYDALFIADHPSALHKIITPYHGVPGKGSALRTMCEVARRVSPAACAVVDADVRSITPEWIGLLLQPILEEQYDYVAPYYLRHKYEGTITNSIVYPLTRSLYGDRIRQPIGGEFGFSGRLALHYADQPAWETDTAYVGSDVWMTTEALAFGAKVCQSFLGAKIQSPSAQSTDLVGMLSQVVGALFSAMEAHEAVWWRAVGSDPVPVFGFQYEVAVEPVHVHVDGMLASFDQGLRDLGPVWEQMLAPETYSELGRLDRSSNRTFHMPDELWTQIVYDAATAFRHRVLPREHVLKALTPLYLGHTASFVCDTQDLSSREAEDRVESLCLAFERLKPSLMAKWRRTTMEELEASLQHIDATPEQLLT